MATQEQSSKTPESRSKIVDTGSGAFIGGSVSTGGGNFVGRDQVTRGVYGGSGSGDAASGNSGAGAKGLAIAQDLPPTDVAIWNLATWDGIYGAFAQLIEAAQTAPAANVRQNVEVALRLRDQVMHIRSADDFAVAELLETWCRQIPEHTAQLLAIFASPLLMDAQGPATRYVLDRLGQA